MKYYDELLVYRTDALQDAVEHNEIARTAYVIYKYITEVSADGIIGYFSGYAAYDAHMLVAAMQKIDAPISLKIMQEVLALFPDGIPATDDEERWAQIDKIVEETGTEDPWENLNRQFLANLPELDIQFTSYLQNNRELILSFPEDNDLKQNMYRVMKEMKR